MRPSQAAKLSLLVLVIFAGAAAVAALPQWDTIIGTQTAAARNKTVYDGNWWLKQSEYIRSGFLSGLADYLRSVAKARWLKNARGETDEITQYYRRDPRNLAVLVLDAWRRVLTESPPPPPLPGGEVWTGPHGYYDGGWYKMISYDGRLGYLSAYLWCLRTYGKVPATAYPHSIEYYDNQIWNYIQRPDTRNEPVADTLARFRSKAAN